MSKKLKPTEEQQHCLDLYRAQIPFTIEALAGSGKTSTLKMMTRDVGEKALYLCFNKAIQLEAQKEFPKHVTCMTTNALAYRHVVPRFNHLTKSEVSEQMTGNISAGYLAKMLNYPWKGRMQITPLVEISLRAYALVLATAIRRFCMSDSLIFEPWMVMRNEGALGTLEQTDWLIFAEKVIEDASKVWARMMDPNDKLKLGFDGTMKLLCLEKPQLPFGVILVDEAQDTAPNVLGLLKAQRSASCIAVGDQHQCQPAGTLVTRVTRLSRSGRWVTDPAKTEEVPIEQIREGDLVVSWSISRRHRYCNGKRIEKVASRRYIGELIVARSGDKVSRYTPNHKCIAKLAGAFQDKHFVYLMEKDGKFRVGKAAGALNSQKGAFGFGIRARAEQPDRFWLLSSHETDREARIQESLIAFKYNIPTLCFLANGSRTVCQDYLDEFWSRHEPNKDGVREILRSHGREYDFPIWQRGDGNLISRRWTVIHACNLMDGMEFMAGHPSDNGTRLAKRDEALTISVSRERYDGTVYSLQVADTETYIADGMFTHNSIYGWRGAVNAMQQLGSASTAYLTQSFRFGQTVADHANLILGGLGAAKPMRGNPAITSRIGPVQQPDAVLCRTNHNVLMQAIDYLDAGKRPHVVGGTKDIESALRAADDLMAGKESDHPDFLGYKSWGEAQEAAGKPEGESISKFVLLIDQMGVGYLRSICRSLSDKEDGADIILSTGHRSKGREWGKVRLGEDFLRGIKLPDESKEGEGDDLAKPQSPSSLNGHIDEGRLLYVAATRGMYELEVPPKLTEKLSIWLDIVDPVKAKPIAAE